MINGAALLVLYAGAYLSVWNVTLNIRPVL